MKKILFIISLCLLVDIHINAQTTTFDNLNANNYVNKAITWNSSNYGSGFGHRIINSDPGGQTLLNFQARNNTTTWSDIMTITSTGKIGIGTTNPLRKLYINAGFDDGLALASNNAILGDNGSGSFTQLLFWNGSNAYYGRSQTGIGVDNHFFRTQGVTRLTIKDNGNIGIGTNSPIEKLSINEGNINVFGYNTSRYLRFTEANLQGAFINYDGTSNVLNIGVNNINSTDTNNDVNSISVVRSTGNVGVGTTSPDAKLAVKGNIHTNEVKVDLLGAVAPDYVFYKDYKLKTLNEVENYITKEGHLPNIPSAKEMETNGLLLKEMNLKLLEKIEELTLYTIQQEKEIRASKNETTALKNEVENQKIINKNLEQRLQKVEALLNTTKQ